jgi:ABC-type transporter MlaC component
MSRSLPLAAFVSVLAAAAVGEPPGVPAHGPAADAAARIQALFDDAAGITGDDDLSPTAKRARLEQLIDPVLDNAMLAQAALGPLAERFDREEYAEFSHEYARFITASLVRRFAAFPGKGSEVSGARWNEERELAYVSAQGVAVKTAYPGVQRLAKLEPAKIELALRRRYGEWRLAGFRRDDVDVARAWREQFAALLEREEPAELIEGMRERNAKSDAENPFAANE